LPGIVALGYVGAYN